MTEKKVVTRNPATTKPTHTKNTMKAERRKRAANMDTRNSTRRDQRPLDTTRRPTRMNTTNPTNSTMTSTKKANIRNSETSTHITLLEKEVTRRANITKKDSKKVETRRRVAQKRDTSMKLTKDLSTRMDTNLITLTMKSTERREERTEKDLMDSPAVQEAAVEDMEAAAVAEDMEVRISTSNTVYHNLTILILRRT